MPEEHVMQIDPQYPYSKQSDEGSDAGSRNEDTQQQQGDQQPYEEQSVQTDQEGQEGQEGRQATGDPREAIVALRRENQQLKQQMQYMSAVVQQSQQQPQQPGQQQDIFAEYDDDDVITVADMKKVLQQQGQPQQRGPDVRELQMMVQFPDYEQEIQKIPKLLENAKFLVSAISNSENPFMTAYFLAKHFADGQPQQQPKGQGGNNQVAQQIMDNLSKPRSVSQAGSGGTIARANYYAQLDDDALEAEITKAKRG